MKSIGNGKKVFVGLSGGVDSSVSAVLLKKAGYSVTGVFIKVWQPDFFDCTSKDDRLDAMRVCAKLDIPFLTLDLENEYKKEVVDYMVDEYKKGNTPNPDVMCNKKVKFGEFLSFAIKNGADYVATGHYVKNILNKKSGLYEMHQSSDEEKDQSYFLWTLGQKELSRIIFPVGGYKKPQVRNLAKKFNLITALKKDSQGLCFVGKVDMKDFLKHFIKENSGKVLDENGNIIGKHEGAIFYTIGERHGFVIENVQNKSNPYYVIDKNIKENTLTVSSNPQKLNLGKDTVSLKEINFTEAPVKIGDNLMVRFRYRQKLSSCVVSSIDKNKMEIKLFKKDNTISSGQSAVFYLKSKCVGGGIII